MEKQNPFSLAFWKSRTQLLLLLYAVSLLLLFLLAKLFLPQRVGADAALSLSLSLIFSLLLPAAFCLYMEDGEVFLLTDSPFSWQMLGRTLSALLSALALSVGYKALLLYLGKELSYGILALSPEAPTPLTYLAFGLLPAFLEEWLCRGLVFSHLRQYGALPVALLTAVLSAVLYFPSPLALPFFLLLGLLFSLLRAAVGSFYPTFFLAATVRVLLVYQALTSLSLWQLEGQNMLLLALGGIFLFLLFAGFALIFPQMKRILKSGKGKDISLSSLLLSPVLWGTAGLATLFYLLLY